MKDKLYYWEYSTDYKPFFEDGVTEESIDRAIQFAKIKGFMIIDQLINEKYYFGMPKYLYDSYLNLQEQQRIFIRAGYFNYWKNDALYSRPLTYKDCYYGQ